MLTREILARLDASKTELRGILETHQGNALPDEVATRADAIEAEIGRLDVALRRSALIEDADRRSPGRPLDGSAGSPGRAECRAFADATSPVPQGFDGALLRSQHGDMVPALEARHKVADFLPPSETRAGSAEIGIGRFLKMIYIGPGSDAERRALAEASVGSGGALVPVPLAAELIDLLRARSVAFAAGARTIPMASATLRTARLVADPVGSWRPENSPLAVSDPTYDALTLAAKTWGLIVKVSRELLEDATNLDAQLRETFGRVAATALDRAILYGSGTNSEPLGVANTPNLPTISLGANGSTLSTYGGQNGPWAAVLDATAMLDSANAGTITAMVAAPRTARAISGFNDASGNPMSRPLRLENVPLLVTTSAPITETQGTNTASSSLLIGDFTEVMVGIRTQLQVTVLNERYMDTGTVGFCLWMRADVGIARPAALVRVSGITG